MTDKYYGIGGDAPGKAYAIIKYDGVVTYLYDKAKKDWVLYPNGYKYVTGYSDDGYPVDQKTADDIIASWK